MHICILKPNYLHEEDQDYILIIMNIKMIIINIMTYAKLPVWVPGLHLDWSQADRSPWPLHDGHPAPAASCIFLFCFCSFLSRWSVIATKYLRRLLLFTARKGKSVLTKYYCPGTGTYHWYLKQFRFSRRAKRNSVRTNETQVMENGRQHDDDLQYRLLSFKYLSSVGWINIQSIFQGASNS